MTIWLDAMLSLPFRVLGSLIAVASPLEKPVILFNLPDMTAVLRQ